VQKTEQGGVDAAPISPQPSRVTALQTARPSGRDRYVGASLPAQLVIGPSAHGVVEYARDVSAAVTALLGRSTVVAARNVIEAEHLARHGSGVHVHVADRIFGASSDASAEAIERIAGAGAVTVTLHDLPQPSDGPVNFPRRTAAYRRIALAARGVVVSSAHEARLFADVVGPGVATPAVIPLGTRIRRCPLAAPNPSQWTRDVVIAGYFYPGKGHEEVIAALARLASTGATETLTGLGAISPGHEGEYQQLVAAASAAGIQFAMSGYLDRAEYDRRLATVGVPVAAHTHLSASRSILDWIEAGRRPLVIDTAYAREVAELRPGVLWLYDEHSLVEVLAAASSDAEATRLAPGTDLGFSLADAAETYLHWWANEVAW